MAKKKEVEYFFDEEDLMYHRFAVRNDFAVVKKPVPDRIGMYWVAKYKPSKYKNVQYCRIDKQELDKPNNRVMFNNYEADKFIAETLKQFYNLKKEKNGNN
jgi:hypothetical protein